MAKMTKNLVGKFQTLTIHNYEETMGLIENMNEIPPSSLVNDMLFGILMDNCEEEVASQVKVYLNHYLGILPVKSESFQYDYGAVLHNTNVHFEDTWCVFAHCVESSFLHLNIYNENEISSASEVVVYPNCGILIQFFVNWLTKFTSLENGLFEEDSTDDRLPILLDWINKIYKRSEITNLSWKGADILKALHKLLEEKLKYEMISRNTPSKLRPLINLILDKCPDIFSNIKNLKVFQSQSHLLHVNANICQHKLYELLNGKKIKIKEHIPLTLKTIIFNYFFIATKEEAGTLELPVKRKNAKNTKKQPNKLFKHEEKGNTKLHKVCHENKFGDLLEILLCSKDPQINARNCMGRSPLHVACLSKSFGCAKNLLEDVDEGNEKADLKARDKNGLTPLHYAAYTNSEDIATLLLDLKHGGPQLATIKDNFGEKPVKYAHSKKMKTLLEKEESKLPETTKDITCFQFNKDRFTAPTMKNKEEYSIFLYGLHLMLLRYLRNSNLGDYKKEDVQKLSHEQHKCPHYVPLTSAAVCDEDVSIFKSMLQIIDHFIASIESNAKKFDIKRSLLEIKFIRVMLKSQV